jgi:hypothetical protein
MSFDETFPNEVIKIAALIRDRIERLDSDRGQVTLILDLLEGDARALEDLARWVIQERCGKSDARRT